MLKYRGMRRLIYVFIVFLFIAQPSFSTVINIDLDSLIELGLKENCELKIKRMELETYAKDIKIANRLKNPQIQSNIMLGNVAIGNASQAGVALPIEVLKRGVRTKSAIQQYSIKETELKQAEHNYKIKIMRAYFDVLYAKSVYHIQNKRLTLFKKLVDLTTDNTNNSINYEIDNLKADIQYEQQLILVNRAKMNMLAKQFQLNEVLNLGKDNLMYDTKEASLLGNWALLDMKIPDYDFLENIALQYSYQVKISEKNIDKAELDLTLAKRQVIPDVTLAGGYAWQAHSNNYQKLGGAFVGMSMDVPLLYNYSPEIQKADIYLKRSKAQKKAYENRLKYELKKDYNVFKYSAENMYHYQKILQGSEKIVELSTENYMKNQNSYSDIVVSENAHQEVLSQFLNAMSNHFYSYLELMEDIGHDILIEDNLL